VFECLDHYEHGDDGKPVRVAVKSLRAEGLERGAAEVFREAKVLKQLSQSGRSRVIGVTHWGYAHPDPDRPGAGRGPFIAMEYFDGETLEAIVKREGPLGVPELLDVARQVAEAVRDAHGKGVLHRDLKPGNLMARRKRGGGLWARLFSICPLWDVRVIDFGLAVRYEAEAVANQALLSTARGRSLTGSIDFAPPEQKSKLPGVKPGKYSDVYAWGKTCLWLLFKTTEVRGPHWKKLPDDRRGPLQELLDLATMEELEYRLKDFDEVLQRLDAIEGKPMSDEKEKPKPAAVPGAPAPPVARVAEKPPTPPPPRVERFAGERLTVDIPAPPVPVPPSGERFVTLTWKPAR
jgi:serine/threonine protein kinase